MGILLFDRLPNVFFPSLSVCFSPYETTFSAVHRVRRNWQHHKIALWPSGHWARNFGLYLLHTRNFFTVSSYRVAQELQVPCDDGIMFLEIYISTCCNSQKW